MRLAFATLRRGSRSSTEATTWHRLGVNRVIEVERFDLGTIRVATRERELCAATTTALWIRADRIVVEDAWMERAIVAALWAVRLRPDRAIVLAYRAFPTGLRVISDESSQGLICRHGSEGRPYLWGLRPTDLLIANLAMLLQTGLPATTSLETATEWIAARGNLSVVNPFAHEYG